VSARDEILSRIRRSTAPSAPAVTPAPSASSVPDGSTGSLASAYAALPRDYVRAHHDPAETDIVALFAERAADYRAVVTRIAPADLADAIASALRPGGRYVVPSGVPSGWLSPSVLTVSDDPPLSAAALDQVDGVITGCAVAIAETGTVILSHGPSEGRRALTLVPDFHLVVVRAGQVAADLADALGRLAPARPHTLISGPSATSDIELIRVEGVHGPRTLHIVVVG
jgi:L-lactate dehydrogenase complex protein LldG